MDIHNVAILRNRPILAQFIKFVLVGFTNLFIDFAVYLFLTRVLHVYYLIANFFSFTLATINSYILNKKWTFRDTNKNYHAQYVKFYIANAIGLAINLLLLFMLVDVVKLHDIVSKCIAVVIVTFWNFFSNKFWTFKKSDKNLQKS